MDAPVPETLPNGTQAKAEEMSAEAQAHLRKMAERMAAITEMGKCLRCEQVHQAPRLRWKCEGCEDEICWNAVWRGEEFSRPGQNVHCMISHDPKRPDVKRICGVVSRVENVLPLVAPEATECGCDKVSCSCGCDEATHESNECRCHKGSAG